MFVYLGICMRTNVAKMSMGKRHNMHVASQSWMI